MNIIHVDMDAFFASVEELDFPDLIGKPVIVGGGEHRGVVTTANYIARKYGVHSAMPGFKAKRLCPNGIFRPIRYERYKEISKEIFNILYEVTPLVEPLSIDEAFLDVTNLEQSPLVVANNLKKLVKERVGLTVSVGISYNKFLAKLASDWNKPDGLKVINKEQVPDILRPLAVRRVYGIGEKTSKRLNQKGIYTVNDLLNLTKEYLLDNFGKLGIEIYDRVRGIDNRCIKTDRERKSYGKETTLNDDIRSKDVMKGYLHDFSISIFKALNNSNMHGKTITLKYRTASFETYTRSKTLDRYIQAIEEIYSTSLAILETIEFKEPIRLIGLTISNVKECSIYQISIFDDFINATFD